MCARKNDAMATFKCNILHAGWYKNDQMLLYVYPFLTLADTTNVVNALVNNVTNPGNGGTCRRFDVTTFQVSFNGEPGG